MRFVLLFLTVNLAWADAKPAPLADDNKVALSQSQRGQAVLLDVREQDELVNGVLKSAIKFPTSKVGSSDWERFTTQLPANKPIYIYCAKGGRAEKAARLLREKGFRAKNIGGYEDLKKIEAAAK